MAISGAGRTKSWTGLVIIGVGITVAVVAAPFLIDNNAPAQALLGLLVTFITTLVSIVATKKQSAQDSQDELTRYGLQAWRNLDGLAIKVSTQIPGSKSDAQVLEQWLLDIDQAKWAWRDLLREVFDLQKRLELETEEVAAKYKREKSQTQDPAKLESIEVEQRLELAKLAAKAPLPMKVPVELPCPTCGERVNAQLGEFPGATAHANCPSCGARFPVHRESDGSAFIGGQRNTVPIEFPCPKCNISSSAYAPNDGATEFVQICPGCQTHIGVSGTAKAFTTSDLGALNAQMTCPHCNAKSNIWITPGRNVRFIANCQSCGSAAQIEGTSTDFQVTRPGGGLFGRNAT